MDPMSSTSHHEGLRVRLRSSKREKDRQQQQGCPNDEEPVRKSTELQRKRSADRNTRPGLLSSWSSSKRRIRKRYPWIIPLLLIVFIVFLYALDPRESNIVHPFIFLSYKISSGGSSYQGQSADLLPLLPQSAQSAQSSASSSSSEGRVEHISVNDSITNNNNNNRGNAYGKGPRDIAFVAFYVLVLFFVRAFVMHEILRPLARWLGITTTTSRTSSSSSSSRSSSRSKLARFNEQMYVALYTGFVGPLGLYVYYYFYIHTATAGTATAASGLATNPLQQQQQFLQNNTNNSITNTNSYFSIAADMDMDMGSVFERTMFAEYPHKTQAGAAKVYYLLQAAFWAQQVLVMVLGLETRRRDFRELVAHHFVTVVLVALSYIFHFTVIGTLVFVTHDISDFFLATSKTLNYIDHPLQIPYYAVCVLAWVYLRHYVNLRILYSVLTAFRTVGPFDPDYCDWTAGQFKCGISQVITFTLLAALQMLNLFWLYCLLRNAYRFVAFGVVRDDREDEDDEEGGDEEGEGGSVGKERIVDPIGM